MPERIGGYVLKEGGGAFFFFFFFFFFFWWCWPRASTISISRTARSSFGVKNPLEGVALHEPACDPSGRLWVGSIDLSLTVANPRRGKAKFFRLAGQ